MVYFSIPFGGVLATSRMFHLLRQEAVSKLADSYMLPVTRDKAIEVVLRKDGNLTEEGQDFIDEKFSIELAEEIKECDCTRENDGSKNYVVNKNRFYFNQMAEDIRISQDLFREQMQPDLEILKAGLDDMATNLKNQGRNLKDGHLVLVSVQFITILSILEPPSREDLTRSYLSRLAAGLGPWVRTSWSTSLPSSTASSSGSLATTRGASRSPSEVCDSTCWTRYMVAVSRLTGGPSPASASLPVRAKLTGLAPPSRPSCRSREPRRSASC